MRCWYILRHQRFSKSRRLALGPQAASSTSPCRCGWLQASRVCPEGSCEPGGIPERRGPGGSAIAAAVQPCNAAAAELHADAQHVASKTRLLCLNLPHGSHHCAVPSWRWQGVHPPSHSTRSGPDSHRSHVLLDCSSCQSAQRRQLLQGPTSRPRGVRRLPSAWDLPWSPTSSRSIGWPRTWCGCCLMPGVAAWRARAHGCQPTISRQVSPHLQGCPLCLCVGLLRTVASNALSVRLCGE